MSNGLWLSVGRGAGPPPGEDAWRTPIWQLTEVDGRWAGRGAADCKGNIVMHLTAWRALRDHDGAFPCTIKLISEGSEEQGTGGLEAFVPGHADLLRADAILVCDTGNFAVGVPTLTTTLRGMTSVDIRLHALSSAMHSGMFGGPAPDPVLGLVQLLATLHDEHGNTTVDGLDATQRWTGADYPAAQFRADANVLDGVELMGDGSVADLLWARPSATVLGIDIPSEASSSAAVQASASARVTRLRQSGPTAVGGADCGHCERLHQFRPGAGRYPNAPLWTRTSLVRPRRGLADKGYSTRAIREHPRRRGITATESRSAGRPTPPRRGRRGPPPPPPHPPPTPPCSCGFEDAPQGAQQ